MSKELHVYTTFCTFFLRMNNTTAPFDNVKVRQAFAHAVDRDTYIKVINKNIGKKTYSFLPPGIMGYDAKAGTDYEFDPALAKKLLAEAGYPDGQGFPKVPYNYVAGANNQRRAEWFQAQLKDVLNIDIELQPMETAAYQRATSDPIQKIPGIGRSGWCSDYVHPADWLGIVFKSGGDQGNANDLSGFKDAEFDKLSDQADAELDPAKAETLYKDLQKRLIDAAPVVFIHNDEAFVMVKPRVKDMWLVALDGGAFGTQSWETIDLQ
jgi:oligopeptide transport system substrate-binding protein